MLKPEDCMLFSGGARGAEATFGAVAEQWGIEEVNFTFDGHGIDRTRGIRVLNHEELQAGDVSLEYAQHEHAGWLAELENADAPSELEDDEASAA